MRLTIRRKLFLAFLGVVAAPLSLLGTLSNSYMKRMRGELDRKFVEEANSALRRVREEAFGGLERIQEASQRFALDRTVRQAEQSSGLDPLVRRFMGQHPEVLGIKMQGRLDTRKRSDEIEQKVEERLRKALAHADQAWPSALSNLSHIFRHRPPPPPPPPGSPLPPIPPNPGETTDPEIELLLKNRIEDIVVEIRGADSKTLFSNLPDQDASTREHLRLAMQDFFRRPKKDLAADAPPLWLTLPHGLRAFLQVPLRDPEGEIGGLMFVEVDPNRLMHPQRFYGSGLAFWLEGKGDFAALKYTPAEAGEIRTLMPPADVLREVADERQSTTTFRGPGDRELRLYWELEPYPALAVAPLDEIHAPLFWGRLQVFVAITMSILLAFWLAYRFSGRFVGAVENIRQGVHAISRGEWAHLEKSSRDELGGDLVESVNRMAITLAERTRREEVANWRRLVRVLSHEINNTLGPVGSVAATIRDRITPRVGDADAAEDLKIASRLIVERVGALSGFISGYSELAKLPDPERHKVDFNQLVKSGAQMFFDDAAKKSIQIGEIYDARAAAALDPRQMERVIINLLKNALEAAPAEGGLVTVRTFRPGRGRVELVVEDNGPGISADARKNLFVPYFTTKPGGTGIGLALVRQIVLGHGGVVAAEDRPGGGTLMRVVLPAAGGALDA